MPHAFTIGSGCMSVAFGAAGNCAANANSNVITRRSQNHLLIVI